MDENRSLFESLHLQYHGMVMQMCLGFMKGDREAASDLSQEVFINIWNSLARFKGDASYKTWIYRITMNTCLQYIRKQKNQQGISIQAINHQLTDQPDDPADYRELYQAIGQLNQVDRLIIMMVLEELEYEELAKIVGISAANLRVKIHRIKKRLKKILDHE